jgi:hypothetical protein
VYSKSIFSPLSRVAPVAEHNLLGISMTNWKIPVESPVSLNSDGSGSNAAALYALPPSPNTVSAAYINYLDTARL